MKIIIVGAGEVGYHISKRLASENKRVTVIDPNPEACRRLTEDLDVQVVTGSGSSPAILLEAGIKDTDILLAVTDSDEINLVACLMTHLLSPTTKKLARIRGLAFDPFHDSFKKNIPHIDTVINPEIEVVNTIRKLMDVPRALDVGDFIDGQVKYVCIRLDKHSPIVGMRLMDFQEKFKDDRPLIAAIIRNSEVIVPRGDNTIEPNDLVYFVCETQKLEQTLTLLGVQIRPIHTAFIVGGGRIGTRLAALLERDGVRTKIIESDLHRCQELSQQMEKSMILHGDGSDKRLFLEENLGPNDVVVSVTHDDETNILVSLLAKSLGTHNTITRLRKSGYYPLLTTIGIERIVSPRLSAVSSILQYVRQGKVLSDISIYREQGEFIEAIALETSGITNRPLKKLSFPKGALLVCIIRDHQIMIPTGESVVLPGDRMILFAVKHAVKKLEKLLTVKLDFF